MAADVEQDEAGERLWHWITTGHVAPGTDPETASHLRQINYEIHLEDLAHERVSNHLLTEHHVTDWMRRDREQLHVELHAAGDCGHAHNEGNSLRERP